MKKFEQVLITSDIDGTILWGAGYINPRNLEKLRYFCENGGHFALATGRNHKDISAIMHELADYVNMPCVLCNGSYLYDMETGEILNPQYLKSEPLMALLTRIRAEFRDRVGFRASYAEGFMVIDDDDFVLRELERFHLAKLANIRPLADFKTEKLFKAVFIAAPETLAEIRSIAEKEFSSFFTITTSDTHILEIQPLGVSKNFQFPYLKERYKGASIWAIGDYDNDLEMLRGADVAVCPANAVEAVKTLAAHEVCHCEDGALADLIELVENSL